MAYNAFVTNITNVRKHSKADRLLIGECFGNQVVVGLDTKEGDTGLYFGADGKLSEEFMITNNLIRNIDVATGKNTGGMFDKNGKVRTQKFREERSDGYFCPLSFLAYTGVDLSTLTPGVAFTEMNGHHICEKFIVTKTFCGFREKKPREKSKFRFFHEHIDTEQLAYKLDELRDNMMFVLTEKLHGTSQRSAYALEEKQMWYGRIINGIFKRTIIQPTHDYKYVCGTRRVVLRDFAVHDGFYKENETFREHAHNLFVGKLNKGEEVFYEVVGYAAENVPLMPSSNNTKLHDKEFVKKYGKTTTFHYGCPTGQHEVYVYRITLTNEDGYSVDLSWDAIRKRCSDMGVKHVPELARCIYHASDVSGKELIKFCDKLVTRESTLTPGHIMEGTVVRADGSHWYAWKYKSFQFRVLEDIIKLDSVVSDMEESQESLVEEI